MLKYFLKNKTLIFKLAKRDIDSKYKGSVIGGLWAVINPVVMLCVYSFVFSEVFKAKWGALAGGKGTFAVVLFSGLIVFNFLAECLSRGPVIFTSNVNYVKKVVFPLGCLPFSIFLSAAFNFLINFAILLVAQFIVFESIPITIIYFPLFLIPLFVVGFSLITLFSTIGVYFRDIAQAVPIIITFLMFLSPIFYPLSAIPKSFQEVMLYNPLAFLIDNARGILIFGKNMSLQGYAILYFASFLFLIVSMKVFQKAKKEFADVL
ncbi:MULTISPECIES: ABC transporter permease [Enterobacterales]|uniref:Transport permease protein n=2 Tax=Enterobacterales TaxID=91347 RepID=A0AAD1LA05_CITBR|nr:MULTISPECIES: ABC transporter permease [Enterobacterales]EKN0242220.1 ABC transporter permease [Citrobacter freundii]WGZ97602.1 ABC transporter permease [Klebsiella michiganensis]EHT9832598.1 ABC transporter permease [Serratia marcescens]EJA2552660.1 ABC transporter permease [Serratia marcescens]EKU7611260.1 ABC transporter permease [Citrobacter freundii]